MKLVMTFELLDLEPFYFICVYLVRRAFQTHQYMTLTSDILLKIEE